MFLLVQTLLTEKADLEKEIRILNDKLSSALAECNAKDEFTKKQTKIGQEAIAGDILFNNIVTNLFSPLCFELYTFITQKYFSKFSCSLVQNLISL